MKYLDIQTPIVEVQEYLASNGHLRTNEQILAIEKPGEGNMNVVLRIKTNKRSFILKQSRPFVQKYQQIEAPLNRIAVENQFYKTVQGDVLNEHIPTILAYDDTDHVLIMKDLGEGDDMTSLYKSRAIDTEILKKLVQCLSLIHQNDVPSDFPDNLKMRQLNHQHIFVLPFEAQNGFELDDIQKGLQELSISYKKDTAIRSVVGEIGKKYLSHGSTLLHGDYYPGSWLQEGENLYIIDPEFGFSGFAEFDLGVMVAHMIMSTADENYLNTIHNLYEGTADKKLTSQVAGIEIMRRLIGLAQLPLERTIREKQYLLELARKMILS